MSERCSNIRYIVRLRQKLNRWQKAAAARRLLPDVPSGHIAVTVGASSKRYVVPATHLNHPLFQKLLIQAEEEYGFVNSGPLAIPCGEEAFEEILKRLALIEFGGASEMFKGCYQMGIRSNLELQQPLLHNLAHKSVW